MPPPLSPPRGLQSGGSGADPLRDDEDDADGDRIGVKLVLRDDESDVEDEIQGAASGLLPSCTGFLKRVIFGCVIPHLDRLWPRLRAEAT